MSQNKKFLLAEEVGQEFVGLIPDKIKIFPKAMSKDVAQEEFLYGTDGAVQSVFFASVQTDGKEYIVRFPYNGDRKTGPHYAVPVF